MFFKMGVSICTFPPPNYNKDLESIFDGCTAPKFSLIKDIEIKKLVLYVDIFLIPQNSCIYYMDELNQTNFNRVPE